MSDLTDTLDAASLALRTAEAANDYREHPPTDGRYGITVEWTWGTSANRDGYTAIKRFVTEQVERTMPDLIDAAVTALNLKAEAARDEAWYRLGEIER